MLNKAKVLLTVNQLSNQFILDELLDRLFFLNKVEEGLKTLRQAVFLKVKKPEKG